MILKRFDQLNEDDQNEEEWSDIETPDWHAKYRKYTDVLNASKVLMYNPFTGKATLTEMKIDNPRFKRRFKGYIPICIVDGWNVGIRDFE
jgi:hypothetical protein